MREEEYIYVKKKIRELIGINLNNYNNKQMMRRLDGYISRTEVSSVAHYFQLLEKDVNELAKLRDFLTINVSEFFRDAIHFKLLLDKILPDLLQQKRRLNIWSAGCSNGAEPYTVAMILEKLSPLGSHRILATDIDKTILEKAVDGGPYQAADIKNIAEPLVSRYFTFKEGNFWVVEKLRKKVLFRQSDLTGGLFEEGFDLIICRNVVIYFSEEIKQKLRNSFFNSLNANGILFIGATETMLDAATIGFQRIAPCFYRKPANISDMPEKVPQLVYGGVR